MIHLHYECTSGISGDMNLAALIDLGVPLDYLVGQLARLAIADTFSLRAEPVTVHGIGGTRVHVDIKEQAPQLRHLSTILEIIDTSPLEEAVKQTAKGIFHQLGEAEATVHGVSIESIHFHELGAVDTIVDIVGAASAWHYLQVQQVSCSPIELGGGFVECAHGTLPVPAPATVQLLRGKPVTSGNVPFECTTPTGAALMAHRVDHYAPFAGIIERVGYGFGHKTGTTRPNALRVFASPVAPATLHTSQQMMAECNLDDMNPEWYPHVMAQLFAAGALDVFVSPIVMKKSRPAHKLSVLYRPEHETAVFSVLLRQTTTFGLRSYPVRKCALETHFEKVVTPWGDVPVKVATSAGVTKYKAESDHCQQLAQQNGVSLAEIYQAVANAWDSRHAQ